MPEDGISVVCPTYNSAPYIKRALETLLLQEQPPEQVVFSDDGSNDDTIEQISSIENDFHERGIDLVFLRNDHQGPGAARNHGIKAANQSWIAFLDSDDTWKPEKLKKVRQSILQNPEVNCFIHWEDFFRINGTVDQLKHGDRFDPEADLSRQLYRGNFLSTSAVVCRKGLVEKAGFFDVSLPNGQDYELWLSMSPWMKLQVLPEILGCYNEEPKSITARPYYKRLPAELKIA